MNYQQMPYGYNPYQQRLNQMQQPMMQHYEIIKVAGRNGASQFPMDSNSTILLLDESEPLVWYVASDGAGYKKDIIPYKIIPYEDELKAKNIDLEERVKRLEEIINESNTTKDVEQSKRK